VNFAVLAGSTVTNTGITTINGNLGVSPGSAYTGAGTVTQTGTVYLANGVAGAAEADVTTAYDYLAGMPVNTVLTGFNLGTLASLAPGVYAFSSSAFLDGTLTLDASSDPNGMYVFQIGTTLIAGSVSNAAVDVIGGGPGLGVYWQVGSSATLYGGTTFAGNILALDSISLKLDATICGRALAQTGGVTMIGNTVSDACPASDFGSASFAGSGSATPEPGTVPLFCVGLLALALYGWRSRKRVA
jgi:type VI secretion system secreted protein VgrG